MFDIFLIFAPKHRLWVHVRTDSVSKHRLWVHVRVKIRKIAIPLQTPILLIKVGFKGVYIARTCFPDDAKTVTIADE